MSQLCSFTAASHPDVHLSYSRFNHFLNYCRGTLDLSPIGAKYGLSNFRPEPLYRIWPPFLVVWVSQYVDGPSIHVGESYQNILTILYRPWYPGRAVCIDSKPNTVYMEAAATHEVGLGHIVGLPVRHGHYLEQANVFVSIGLPCARDLELVGGVYHALHLLIEHIAPNFCSRTPSIDISVSKLSYLPLGGGICPRSQRFTRKRHPKRRSVVRVPSIAV